MPPWLAMLLAMHAGGALAMTIVATANAPETRAAAEARGLRAWQYVAILAACWPYLGLLVLRGAGEPVAHDREWAEIGRRQCELERREHECEVARDRVDRRLAEARRLEARAEGAWARVQAILRSGAARAPLDVAAVHESVRWEAEAREQVLRRLALAVVHDDRDAADDALVDALEIGALSDGACDAVRARALARRQERAVIGASGRGRR